MGGGLGQVEIEPVDIELVEGAKLYTGRFYNTPKAYKGMAKTEVNCLCIVDVLEKLSHTEDSPWAAPSFCQIKKIGKKIKLSAFIQGNLTQHRGITLWEKKNYLVLSKDSKLLKQSYVAQI